MDPPAEGDFDDGFGEYEDQDMAGAGEDEDFSAWDEPVIDATTAAL